MDAENQGMPQEAALQSDDAPRKRKTTRKVLLGFLGFFVIVAVVAGFFVYNLAHSFDSKAQKIDNAFPSESLRPTDSATGAMNFLVLGSDSRGDSVDLAESGSASNQRSDTIMMVHIPADRKNVYAMSIMRDTWVDIPGHGEAKINAAMAFGGIPLVVQTIEGLFGARIDHVMVVDFEGFKAITDAVGGVTVNIPKTFKSSSLAGHTFEQGKQTLNGDEALAFVRERYAFADGDYQRVADQQQFLKALTAKVFTPAILANPISVSNLVDKFSPYISVDKDLNAAAIGALALELKDIRASNIKTFTLPTLGTGTSADGQSIVIADKTAISEIGQAMKDEELGTYLQTHKLGG